MNPIFIEYYSHENQDCYKINLPWTAYRRHTVVLATVTEGLEVAKAAAFKAISEHLLKVMEEEIPID